MPTYLNLTISLISQYDAMSLPEFQPPPSDPEDPFSESSHPALISESQPIVSVYIPTYPCSTFWISYAISPPHPDKIMYYFKLFVNGTHVVSWGCGEKDNYTGKTMFGLFRGPLGRLERRMLSFASHNDAGRSMSSEMMEVRVYRSKGRRRTEPEIQQFKPAIAVAGKARQLHGAGIRLINAGYLHHRQHPERYYQYALIDELDSPYATFRYYYRTWEELERLGVTTPSPSASPVPSSVPSASINASINVSDSIRRSQILRNRLSSISLLSLTPSPTTPNKEGYNKTPFNSPENEPSTPTHKPAAMNRIKEKDSTAQSTTPDGSALHIYPTFAFPFPITPVPHSLSPTKFSPTKASSSGQYRRPLTPVPSLERLRNANAATSHLTLPTLSLSSDENALPSPRRSIDSTSTIRLRQSLDSASSSPTIVHYLPRTDSLPAGATRSIRPQLNLDAYSGSSSSSTPRSRTSIDTLRLSASATRRTEFGGLVASLMGQSPSPKRPRRYVFSGAAVASGYKNAAIASRDATTGDGNDNGNEHKAFVRSPRNGQKGASARNNRHEGRSNGTGGGSSSDTVREEAGPAATTAAREAPEEKGSAKARRKVHLGFLMGRTERRLEKGWVSGMEGGTELSRGRERVKGLERNKDGQAEKERERKSDSASVSMRAHIRALANGVPIQGVRGEVRRREGSMQAAGRDDGVRGEGDEGEGYGEGKGEGYGAVGLGIAF